MKKLVSIALCAMAVSAFGETVAELGQVGVTAITSSLQNTIVAVSYDDLAGGSGMVVSNFVKTANLTKGDQLAVYNGGEYTSWILTEGEGGALYWAKNDKTFKVDAEGAQSEGTGPLASDVIQAVGTGIWLCRATKPTGAFTFYIYGKPSTAKMITTTPVVWNLVGNPTQGDVTITDDIVSGAQTGDRILVPAAAGLVDYRYKTEKGWRAIADASGNWGDAPTVTAGTGFWIMTKSAVTITWSAAQ